MCVCDCFTTITSAHSAAASPAHVQLGILSHEFKASHIHTKRSQLHTTLLCAPRLGSHNKQWAVLDQHRLGRHHLNNTILRPLTSITRHNHSQTPNSPWLCPHNPRMSRRHTCGLAWGRTILSPSYALPNTVNGTHPAQVGTAHRSLTSTRINGTHPAQVDTVKNTETKQTPT